jgi:hypothetical protein
MKEFSFKGFEFDNVKAVTFDSPGSLDYLQILNDSNIYDIRTKFELGDLNIVTYLSAPNFTNTFDYSAVNNGLIAGTKATRTDKLIIVTRKPTGTSNTDLIRYRDATQYASNTSLISSLQNCNNEVYLFAQSDSADNAILFTTHECSFAFMGLGLNSTEVTNFNTAVQNLQTSLFRQV